MLTNQGHPASSPFTHPSRPGPTCGAVTGCDSWFICSLLSDHPALEDQGAGVKTAQRWVGLGWARLAAAAALILPPLLGTRPLPRASCLN